MEGWKQNGRKRETLEWERDNKTCSFRIDWSYVMKKKKYSGDKGILQLFRRKQMIHGSFRQVV